jgi:hypothetical protein
MMLTQLADVARSAGLRVIEVDGWKTRTSLPGEQMIDVQTITCHHTANGGAGGDAPSLNTVVHGRPGLGGPLAHYLLSRSGTVYVVAAGHCNHAGVSLKTAYTNSHAIGIEAEAVGVPGTAGDWPPVQMAAYARLCAALVSRFGLSVADVRGHKETCSPVGRKSDPDFDMAKFRAQVAAVDLTAKMEDDDMQWTDTVKLTATDAKIWGGDYKEGQEVTFGLMVRYPTLARKIDDELAAFITAQTRANTALTQANTALAQANAALSDRVDALTKAVTALNATTPDAIAAAFTEGIAALNADLKGIDITVTSGS